MAWCWARTRGRRRAPPSPTRTARRSTSSRPTFTAAAPAPPPTRRTPQARRRLNRARHARAVQALRRSRVQLTPRFHELLEVSRCSRLRLFTCGPFGLPIADPIRAWSAHMHQGATALLMHAGMISSQLELHRYATGRQSRIITAMTLLKSHLFKCGSTST